MKRPVAAAALLAFLSAPAGAAPYDPPRGATFNTARDGTSCPQSVKDASGAAYVYKSVLLYYSSPFQGVLQVPAYEGPPNVFQLKASAIEAPASWEKAYYAQCSYGEPAPNEKAWVWIRIPVSVSQCTDEPDKGFSCR